MKKITLSLAILMLLLTNNAFSQKNKLVGAWELMQRTPQGDLVNVFRNFDIEGNYTQIVIPKNGAIITVRAAYKEFSDGKLTEQISFSTYPGNAGKIFSFNYRFSEEGGRQFLILEKGTKSESGYTTVEWQEAWRKIEEYKQ